MFPLLDILSNFFYLITAQITCPLSRFPFKPFSFFLRNMSYPVNISKASSYNCAHGARKLTFHFFRKWTIQSSSYVIRSVVSNEPTYHIFPLRIIQTFLSIILPLSNIHNRPLGTFCFAANRVSKKPNLPIKLI